MNITETTGKTLLGINIAWVGTGVWDIDKNDLDVFWHFLTTVSGRYWQNVKLSAVYVLEL